jgi:RND family efflux transporter MFP subunit
MKKVLIGIFAVFLLGACGKDKNKETTIKKKPRSVRYIVAYDKNPEYKRTFSGNIISEIESRLSFRVNGTIVNKYFKMGDYVKKGQILAELDNKDYKLSLENSRAGVSEAEAGLKRSEASFMNSKNEFSRIEKLYYDDNVSKSDYDTAKANKDVSEAELAQAKASLKASSMQLAKDELNLEYTKLIAPQNGFIASEEKEENETITAGTPVYRMSLGDNLETKTFIPENLVGTLTKGQEVSVEISAFPGKIYRGEIKEIGSSSSGYGNSYPLKVTLLENNNMIKPGMSTKITFDLSKGEEKEIVVPLNAIGQDASEKNFVYILTDMTEGIATVKKSVITLGNIYSEGVAITEGIETGDYIVSSGVSQITEGQKVSVSIKEEN